MSAFPSGVPLDAKSGFFTTQWRAFLQDLYNKTGGAGGAVYASSITNVPAGHITATDVQAALNQLDSIKGTVNSFTFTNASGISGTVTTPTTTPTLSLALGAITPLSVAASGTVTGSNLSGTNTGDQTISLTGDVTGTGTGSFAATIAASAVTLAKMADVATSSVFYRKTAGTGAPEVQTLAALKTDLGLTGTNSGDQTITLTGGVTGSGTGSFAATLATPGTLTVSTANSNATAHTHAITSSSAPGAAASILATDASGIIGSTGTRIVKGWFTDLTVTNAIAGSVTGSAATLTTPRAINGTNFDGSAAITVTAAAGTLTGATLNSTVTASSLTSVGTLTALVFTTAGTTGATFTTAGSTSTLSLVDTGASGANFKLAGDGATTPNKYLRVTGGVFQIVNSAYGANCMALTDAGALTTLASIGANSGTAIPAGGTAGAGLKVSSATNFGIFFGSGAPTLSAAQGSLYLRSDGSSTSTRLYVNTTGSTTWTNATTAA